MCEKKTRKFKKGSQLTRLREARRVERLQRLPLVAPPSSNETTAPCPQPAPVNKTAQNRVILELAWRTIGLMQKNRLIQQKIIALQKETSDFIASVMSNPENQRRYIEHVRLYGIPEDIKLQIQPMNKGSIPIKIEPST